MTKAEIRRDMKILRSNISEVERKDWDATIRRQLQQTEEYQCCKTLFCYVSFGSELDTGPIILQALQEGKVVYVPRVDEKHRMQFYRIHDLGGLQPSRFGVPEPSGEEEKRYQLEAAIHSHDIPLMLLPGLAFDITGNRIGYGAGYYDRYLLEFHQSHFYKMALCYDFQLIEHIEAQEYDIGVDTIITPTKRIKCR
jgi:5-formyltetrahydrofolate cyclo-ligase